MLRRCLCICFCIVALKIKVSLKRNLWSVCKLFIIYFFLIIIFYFLSRVTHCFDEEMIHSRETESELFTIWDNEGLQIFFAWNDYGYVALEFQDYCYNMHIFSSNINSFYSNWRTFQLTPNVCEPSFQMICIGMNKSVPMNSQWD